MPGLWEFLPQPPWEGPPVPKFLSKGVEYISRPYELEVDPGRGVLYLHSLPIGLTVLRICRIPEEVWKDFGKEGYPVLIDLLRTQPKVSPEVTGMKIIKESPVFLDIGPRYTGFTIDISAYKGIWIDVLNVPEDLVRTLEKGEFVDVTLGYTGRGVG